MAINPTTSSNSWNYSNPDNPGYSTELVGTVVAIQEVQAMNFGPGGKPTHLSSGITVALYGISAWRSVVPMEDCAPGHSSQQARQHEKARSLRSILTSIN